MARRTRTRTRELRYGWGYKARSITNPSHTWGDTFSGVKTLEIASMIDTVGNRRGNNPVEHIQWHYDPANFTLPEAISKDGSCASTEWGINSMTYGTLGAVSCEYDLSKAWSDLLADATGEMPLQASLVVNAAEFAMLKTLIPGLLTAFTGFRKHKWTRRSIKDLATSHLAYEFGLAPVLRDFRGFLGTRSSIQKRIQELLGRNGRKVRIAKRDSGSGEGQFIGDKAGDSSRGFSWVTKGTAEGVACISADVTSFFVPDGESQCRLWSSALGLSTPLSNIWELIPFSFVIDWFIPIGNGFKSIERKLKTHETTRSCTIDNVSESYKCKTIYTTQAKVRSTTFPAWNNLVFVGVGGRCISYSRRPCGPPDFGASLPSGWTLRRTALAVSLIAQAVIK